MDNKKNSVSEEEALAAIKSDIDFQVALNKQLSESWYRLVAGFVAKNLHLLIGNTRFGALVRLISKTKKVPQPSEIANACKRFFTDQQLVQHFCAGLSDTEKAFLDLLIWYQEVPHQKAVELFGEEVLTLHTDSYRNPLVLKKAYILWDSFLVHNFTNRVNYRSSTTVEEVMTASNIVVRFKMPKFMRLAFIHSGVTVQPADYTLNAIALPEDDARRVFQSEQAIFDELPSVILMIKNHTLRFNKAKGNIFLPSLKEGAQLLTMDWFESEPRYLKLQLIASWLHPPFQLDLEEKAQNTIQRIFGKPQVDFAAMESLLYPFEGVSNFQDRHFNLWSIKEVFRLFKNFPKNEWVSLENIFSYVGYHFADLFPIKADEIHRLRMHPGFPASTQFNDGRRHEREAILRKSFINSTLLMAAAFGLLDLAFDNTNDSGQDKADHPYTGSFFACRLTALGAYILRLEKHYVPPVPFKRKFTFALSEDSLTIRITGNTYLAGSLLKAWATPEDPQSPDILTFDPQNMLRPCENKQALIAAVDLFRTTVDVPLPDYWKIELMQLVYRTESICQVTSKRLYRFNPNDSQLKKMLVHDPILKSLITKVEGHGVLINRSDQKAFTQRLTKLRYLINDRSEYRLDSVDFDHKRAVDEMGPKKVAKILGGYFSRSKKDFL